VLGEYCLKDLLDLRTGKPLKHTINGEELDFYALPNGRHRVARKGSSRALGTLMPPAPVHAAPVLAAPATAPPAELAAPRPDAVTSAALSAHAADVRQTVLTLMEQQARIVHATEGDPIDKARVLAQLCQVALNAVDGKAAPTP